MLSSILLLFPSLSHTPTQPKFVSSPFHRDPTEQTTAMLSSILLLFPSLFLILITQTTAQPKFQYQFCRTDEGNYTANSTYKANLNTLLSNLTSNIEIDYGFYNSSHGQNSDKVYAVGLCRGDVKSDGCRSCLNDTIVLLPKVCTNQKEAIAGYDNSMLRYSNQSLYGILETRPSFLLGSGDNATDPDRFNQATRELLESLRSRAASGNSNLRKYAAGNETGPNFQTIFALVQCTPDLSEQECTDCLVRAFSDIKGSNILGERGGRIIKPSCNFRYENSRFYDPTIDTQPPPPPPSTNTTSKGGKKSNALQTVIAIVVPIVACIVIFIFIYLIVKRKSWRNIKSEVDQDLEIGSTESLQLDFGTISVATDNFSDSNKLGQGGFGAVYKGRLSNGQEIAVKRLSRESHQGDLEFKNEVLLLAKLQHRNLVRLLGFCLEGGEKLLIYEFMPKKSLDYLLFDQRSSQLDCERCYNIIRDIARGLVYLHEDSRLRIIHRDLKASNILLDVDLNPKISDFGMARLFALDQTQGNTSKIAGTTGYMAPEYVMRGHFSVKSDVYSFGVLVLEIVSGKKIIDFTPFGQSVKDLISFAWRNWRDGTFSNLIDPVLNDESRSEVMRCIHIGLLCVQKNVAARPTMASIGLVLNKSSTILPAPSEPPLVMDSGSVSEWQSQEYNSGTTRSSELQSESAQESKCGSNYSPLFTPLLLV